MSRSIFIGMLAGAGVVVSSAAGAAALAPLASPTTSSFMHIQYYPPCPPGYKVTSYGACKKSHYLQRHPEQDPELNYGYGQQRRYYDGYDDGQRYYRRSQRRYYQDDNDDNGDY